MGHKRLGYLPKTKAWRFIVSELGLFALGSVEVNTITQNTLRNIQSRYSNLENDPSIQSGFEFLLHLSYAFRKENPLKYFQDNNILDKENISVLEVAKAAKNYKNKEAVSHEYATIAKQAAIDAVNKWYKNNIESGQSLFSEKIDTNAIFNKATKAGGFCELS